MNDTKFAVVIDDSESMRKSIVSILLMLRENGDLGEILEAENTDIALRLMLKQEGKLQFVISRWNIPGMPLADFLKIIQYQPRLAGAPLLLLIEEGNETARAVAKEVGATAVLTTPLDSERVLVLTTAVTGTTDRRRAKRITPLIPCKTELRFSKAKRKIASATIVNISDTGILLRTPLPPRGLGFVYDIANMVFHPVEGESIKIPAQILRIEPDPTGRASAKEILMALEYQQMDIGVRQALGHYLQLNDQEPLAAANQ